LDLPEGSRIEDVLRAVGVRVETVSVFTVNGQIIRDRSHVLSANDDLAVLPPAGGG
jgi:sulfur carrier protein ThiS